MLPSPHATPGCTCWAEHGRKQLLCPSCWASFPTSKAVQQVGQLPQEATLPAGQDTRRAANPGCLAKTSLSRPPGPTPWPWLTQPACLSAELLQQESCSHCSQGWTVPHQGLPVFLCPQQKWAARKTLTTCGKEFQRLHATTKKALLLGHQALGRDLEEGVPGALPRLQVPALLEGSLDDGQSAGRV